MPEETVSTIERVEAAPPPARETPKEASTREVPTPVRHISRDYSYVRAEVKRIVVVAGLLIVSLIIVAFLRN